MGRGIGALARSPFALLALSFVLPTPADAEEYVLGPDSLPQEGVPTGTVEKRTWDASSIYPGTTHEYWVYVPAQYTDAEPAAVMVFQDGEFYVDPEGLVRAPTVFDNLIHRGEMPVTIGIFINPGMKELPWDLRSIQYASVADTYARFLLEEILPEVGKDYNLTDEAAGRAIAGMSDGGLASFTVAWHRPDAFSKVVSHVGSYTRLQGGSQYPYLVRTTRGNPKPIRVFLQDGENDINLAEGNWTLANLQMDSALMFARYDYRFEMGTGGHDLRHGGAIFPDTLRWLWRDYPGVVGAGAPADLAAVVGDVGRGDEGPRRVSPQRADPCRAGRRACSHAPRRGGRRDGGHGGPLRRRHPELRLRRVRIPGELGQGIGGQAERLAASPGRHPPRRPEPRCAPRGRLRGRGPQENRGVLD